MADLVELAKEVQTVRCKMIDEPDCSEDGNLAALRGARSMGENMGCRSARSRKR